MTFLRGSFDVCRTSCVDRAHQEADVSGGSDELKTSIVTSHRHDDGGGRWRYTQRCSFVCHFLTERRLAETKEGTRRRGTKSNPFDNRSPPRTVARGGLAGRRPMGVRECPVVVAHSFREGEERREEERREGERWGREGERKGGEMPGITCSEENISPRHFYFVSAENSR